MADTIAEVVPDVAKVAGKLAASSVITGRRRVRLVPQSGQNYSSANSAGIVNILIQDGAAYADLLSACLTFEVNTWNSGGSAGTAPGTGNVCVLDDGAYSVFRRSLVYVNSTLMDDTDQLPRKVNAEIYATVPQGWYDNVGSMLGLYKWNSPGVGTGFSTEIAEGAVTGTTLFSKYDIPNKAVQQANVIQLNNQTASTASSSQTRNKFSIPVSLLTSFFRNDTLFPSRNAGQLYLTLNLNDALQACWGWATSTTWIPNFQISNLTLELDYVDLHPTYLDMMDSIIEGAGEGVHWAFDSHLVQQIPIQGGTTTSTAPTSISQQSFIISKASQNMRSLQVVAVPPANLPALTTGGYGGGTPQQSCFSNPGLVDIQYRIGSLYYPAFTAIGEARSFMDLQNAFGSPESVDKQGIVDNTNYYVATNTTQYAGVLSALNAYMNGSGTWKNGNANLGSSVSTDSLNFSDCWSYAYCFDRLKHARFHGIDLDGVNTLTSSGSQMVVQLNCNPLVAGTQLVAIVRFTRVLRLGGGSTAVIG